MSTHQLTASIANLPVVIEVGAGMVWRGAWQPGHYAHLDLVRDESWLLVCTNPAGTDAAPIPPPSALHDRDWQLLESPTWQTLTSTTPEVWIGLRLRPTQPTYIESLRYWDDVGNPASLRRDLSLRLHPEHQAEQRLIVFENITTVPTVTGWQEATLHQHVLLLTGETCDVLLKLTNGVNIQDDTRNYRYRTPNNPQVPSSGEIVQGTNTGMDLLRIAYVDADATDNTALLQALHAGCTIAVPQTSGGEQVWTVQAVTPQAQYAEYVVTPVALANATTGSTPHAWHFRTVLDNTVTHVYQENAWPVGGPIQGLRQVVGTDANLIVDQTAFGVDVALVAAEIHADWDLIGTHGALA